LRTKLKNFVIAIVVGGSIHIGAVIGAVVGAILSQKSRWICFLIKIKFSFYLFQRQLLPIFHLNKIQINVCHHKVFPVRVDFVLVQYRIHGI
jgi:hypothetical protein